MDHYIICHLFWYFLSGKIGAKGLVGPILGAGPVLVIWGLETSKSPFEALNTFLGSKICKQSS
jgi:hypothetical protein